MNLSFMLSTKSHQPTLQSLTPYTYDAKQVDNKTIVEISLEWTDLFYGPCGQGPIVVTVFNLKDGQPHNKVATTGCLGRFDAATAVNSKDLFAEVSSGQGSNSTVNLFQTRNLTSILVDDRINDNTLDALEHDVHDTPTSTIHLSQYQYPPYSS